MKKIIARHKGLLKYLLRRLVTYLITVWAAVTIVFILPRLIPGSPISAMITNLEDLGLGYGPEYFKVVKYWEQQFGLDKDLWTQYILYMGGLAKGDLGISYTDFPKSVIEHIMSAMPWTIGLLGVTLMISWVLGNILGLFAGWNRDSSLSKTTTYASLLLMQIPYYILALILVYLLAYIIPIFPATGGSSILVHYTTISLTYISDVLWHSILPALSIVVVGVGAWMIGMRQLIVSILGEDYFLYAEAIGLKKNIIMMKYAFRNALLPQMTGLAMRLGRIMSGTMLTEFIFSYPGLGFLLYHATVNQDYNLMSGILLFTIVGVLTANLLMDLIYPIVDPRIVLGGER